MTVHINVMTESSSSV